jgi:hypothetical protein
MCDKRELCSSLKDLYDSLCSRVKGWDQSEIACAEAVFSQVVYQVLCRCVDVSTGQSDEAAKVGELSRERQNAADERDRAASELRRVVTDTESCSAHLRDLTAHMVNTVLSVPQAAKFGSGDSIKACKDSSAERQVEESWQLRSTNLSQSVNDLQSACRCVDRPSAAL